MRNARFWVFINDAWVKLTLKPNQSLGWAKSAPTDEGFSYESDRWTYDGRAVLNQWESGGRDCDGPISNFGSRVCEAEALRDEPMFSRDPGDMFDGMPILRPNWRKVEMTRGQRDAYAEAMGY